MVKKLKRPKAVSYVLIPEHTDVGRPMYELLGGIVDEHHVELGRQNVRIALAWATSWKPDVDGRMMLGKCKKASDLDRELAPYDFVILLNRDFYLNPRVSDVQRRALIDHELMHAAVAFDENGDVKIDERGRTVYRIRKHDLEEFSDIASRYGCWKRDIEQFAQALTRAGRSVAGFWIGYVRVQQALAELGIEIATEVISSWPESDRREVFEWTLLRKDVDVRKVNVSVSQSMPPCLAEALGVTATSAEPVEQSATH